MFSLLIHIGINEGFYGSNVFSISYFYLIVRKYSIHKFHISFFHLSMPFHHNLHSQSLDNIKREYKPKREIYSRIHETMDLEDMYETLDPQVT